MGNCTLFSLHFQQSTKLFCKRLQRWTKVIEIWLGNSIFQPNWNMQKHSYAKSRKSIYFQTQTKIPFFHLRGFLIFNPTGLSFKQSFTIQTRAALSPSQVEAGGLRDSLRLFLNKTKGFKRYEDIGEIMLLNCRMLMTVLCSLQYIYIILTPAPSLPWPLNSLCKFLVQYWPLCNIRLLLPINRL